jgi:DNA-3-methyladenine glycosylase I
MPTLKPTVVIRCGWCSADPLYQQYHDTEWGVPQHDPQRLLEMLCLEGQQAGLSWITVLKKRQRYREQFFDFCPQQMAELTDTQLDERLQDAGLIRHRGKLVAIRTNARAWLALAAQGIDPAVWLWTFAPPPRAARGANDPLPSQTEASQVLSKALKKNGFAFVGATTCYAFMQAVGMVNDHDATCDQVRLHTTFTHR